MRATVVFGLLLLARAALAVDPPVVLVHSGYLLDGRDSPVTEPQQKMTFRILDLPARAGNERKLWEGTCNVGVLAGRYTASLGGDCGKDLLASMLPADRERFLEVVVGTTALAPRLRIGAVPNAALAQDSLKIGGVSLTELDDRYGRLQLTDPIVAQQGSLVVRGSLAGSHVTATADFKSPSIEATTILTTPLLVSSGEATVGGLVSSGRVSGTTGTFSGALAADAARFKSGVQVDGKAALELGTGVARKELNAGKLGYGLLTADALDVVGAGSDATSRKVKVWAEGGLASTGPVAAPAFAGDGSALTGLSAANLVSGIVPDARLGVNVVRTNSPGPFVLSGSLTAPNLSATGQVKGETLVMNGAASVGSLSAAGDVSAAGLNASGDVHAANVTATGAVSTGSLTASGAIGGDTLTIAGAASVGGGVAIAGSSVLELGAGVADKEGNAGKIGYEAFTPGALDIVGAGPSSTNLRRIKFWNEGGAVFTGGLAITGAVSASSDVASGGKLSAVGLVAAGSGVTVGGVAVFDASGTLNQASADRAAQLRVITNSTAGAPDNHLYVNYPVRAGSLTHVYNDTDVTGGLTVSRGLATGAAITATTTGANPCCATEFTAALSERTDTTGRVATLQFTDTGLYEGQFSLVGGTRKPPLGVTAAASFERRTLLASSTQDTMNLAATGSLGSLDTLTGFLLGGGGLNDNYARLTKGQLKNPGPTDYHDLAVGRFFAGGANRFDLAEFTPVDPAAKLEIGEVVSVDPTHDVRLTRSTKAYDSSVIGVVSSMRTASLVIGGDTLPEQAEKVLDKKPIALSGRVPVKVTLEGGPIRRGDLLAASSTPGRAMRAADTSRGGIIGTALSAFAGPGEGEVTVFVHLQPAPDGSRELQSRLEDAERENRALRGEVAGMRRELTDAVEELRSRLAGKGAPPAGKLAKSR